MFQSIGAALSARPAPPVRRHSRHAGHCEAALWRRTSRDEVRQVLLAARRYELTQRKPGRRSGPLGHVGLEIIELLANVVSFKTGRLEPSLRYLMVKLKRSKAAIVRALAALRAHGFLDWIRRFEEVNREGPGPRIRQVSNAYALRLPVRALRLLGLQGPPPPETDGPELLIEIEDLPLLKVADAGLAGLLSQLGRQVRERESARRSETLAT